MAPDPELTSKVMKLKWKHGISLSEAWEKVKKPKKKKTDTKDKKPVKKDTKEKKLVKKPKKDADGKKKLTDSKKKIKSRD